MKEQTEMRVVGGPLNGTTVPMPESDEEVLIPLKPVKQFAGYVIQLMPDGEFELHYRTTKDGDKQE